MVSARTSASKDAILNEPIRASGDGRSYSRQHEKPPTAGLLSLIPRPPSTMSHLPEIQPQCDNCHKAVEAPLRCMSCKNQFYCVSAPFQATLVARASLTTTVPPLLSGRLTSSHRALRLTPRFTLLTLPPCSLASVRRLTGPCTRPTAPSWCSGPRASCGPTAFGHRGGSGLSTSSARPSAGGRWAI